MKKFKLFLLMLAFAGVSKTTFATPGDTLTVSPNPFESVAVIHFEIAASSVVWLEVFNLTGQLIKTFYNDTLLPAGAYSLNFNGDTLPNGAYIVRLKINYTTKAQKIIKNAILGLKENGASSPTILLFPNPTSAMLKIPIDGAKTIVVTDLNGKIVLNTTIQNNAVSLANIENCNYSVAVFSENKELLTSQQIVKASN